MLNTPENGYWRHERSGWQWGNHDAPNDEPMANFQIGVFHFKEHLELGLAEDRDIA